MPTVCDLRTTSSKCLEQSSHLSICQADMLHQENTEVCKNKSAMCHSYFKPTTAGSALQDGCTAPHTRTDIWSNSSTRLHKLCHKETGTEHSRPFKACSQKIQTSHPRSLVAQLCTAQLSVTTPYHSTLATPLWNNTPSL